jgi:hypothetical protein
MRVFSLAARWIQGEEFVQVFVSEGQVPGAPLTCNAEEATLQCRFGTIWNGALFTVSITGAVEKSRSDYF